MYNSTDFEISWKSKWNDSACREILPVSGDGVSEACAFDPANFDQAPIFFYLRAIRVTQYHAGVFRVLSIKGRKIKGAL